ncbi:MAG TPA: hypothetical protein DIS74_05640 [Bacteroidales bacterium]|nr:hypothetical protein [Bacteroidales bacterium]
MQVFVIFFMSETLNFMINESFAGQKNLNRCGSGLQDSCHIPIYGASAAGIPRPEILIFISPEEKVKKDYICTRCTSCLQFSGM